MVLIKIGLKVIGREFEHAFLKFEDQTLYNTVEA